jgi:hypothetical protein
MNLILINSNQPLAAQVELSPCEEETVLLPLTAATQESWNRRSIDNRETFNPTGFLFTNGKQISYNRYGILN